ncbi:MAG: SOS response-associated peptidase [Chloracidobacterium sp.]|nr:SOS response-associated peptidase [Chloracidobacterium sp.]
MCGRISQKDVRKYGPFIEGWLNPEGEFDERPGRNVPRNNIKPTAPAWIVARRGDGLIKTVEARWWCQWDGSYKWEAKYPTFNARVETMHDKKLWPALLKKGQRCLLPIDSFYEWPVKGKGIPPVEIFVEGRNPYALAGLWSRYYEENDPRYSFTVFTCDPNEFMKPIHPKAMPVILTDKDEQRLWLNEGDEALLRPYEGKMESDQLGDTLERLYPVEDQVK